MTEQTDSNISLTSYPARDEAETRRAHARGATTKADTGTPTNGKRTENMAAGSRAGRRVNGPQWDSDWRTTAAEQLESDGWRRPGRADCTAIYESTSKYFIL